MARVIDDLGLVRNGKYFCLVFPGDEPQTAKALPFRVVYRHNQDREVMNYGIIPTSTSDSLDTYEGSSGSPAAAGQIPSRSYTKDYMTFSRAALSSTLNVYDSNDIWYLPDEFNERLFHIRAYFYPEFLRVGLEIPAGTKQERFQRERVIGGVGSSLGWRRGSQELAIFPDLRVGWMFGNDSELAVYTGVRFVYGEYIVKIPDDEDVVWDVLTGNEDVHLLKVPIAQADASVNQAMLKCYGYTGFTVHPKYKKDVAKKEYRTQIAKIRATKPGMLG